MQIAQPKRDVMNTTPERRLNRSLAFKKRDGPSKSGIPVTQGGKVSSWPTLPWSRTNGYEKIQNDSKKPPSRGWFVWGRAEKPPTENGDDSIKEGPKSSWGGLLLPWSRRKETQPERKNLNTTPKSRLNRSLAFKRRDSNEGNEQRLEGDSKRGWFDKWVGAKKSPTQGGQSPTTEDSASSWTAFSNDDERSTYYGQAAKRAAQAMKYRRHNQGSTDGQARSASGWTAFSKDDKRSIYYGQAAKLAAQAMKNKESEYRRLLGGPHNRGSTWDEARSTDGQARSASEWTAFSKDDKRSIYYGQAAKQERVAKALQMRNGGYDWALNNEQRQKRRTAEQLWEERKGQITLEQERMELERQKRAAEQYWEKRRMEVASSDQARREAIERQKRAAEQYWEKRIREVASLEQAKREAVEREKRAANRWRNVKYYDEERRRAELNNEQRQKWRAAEQSWEERKRQIALDHRERMERQERAEWERNMQIVEQDRIARARTWESREGRDRLDIQAPKLNEDLKKLANLKRNLRLEAVEEKLRQHHNKARDLEVVKQSFQALVERERSQIPRKRAGIAILDDLLAKIT